MHSNRQLRSLKPQPGGVLKMLLQPMVWVLAMLALLFWAAAMVAAFGWALDKLVGRTPVMIGAGLLSLLVLAFLIQGYFDYKASHQRSSVLWKGLYWVFHVAGNRRASAVILVALLLMSVALVFCGAILSWRLLPEVLADWVGMMVGIMSTPFFLEASFLFIGLTIVVAINHHRQKKEGDEFVEVQVEDAAGTDSSGKN